jgi:hypothetical protein
MMEWGSFCMCIVYPEARRVKEADGKEKERQDFDF